MEFREPGTPPSQAAGFQTERPLNTRVTETIKVALEREASYKGGREGLAALGFGEDAPASAETITILQDLANGEQPALNEQAAGVVHRLNAWQRESTEKTKQDNEKHDAEYNSPERVSRMIREALAAESSNPGSRFGFIELGFHEKGGPSAETLTALRLIAEGKKPEAINKETANVLSHLVADGKAGRRIVREMLKGTGFEDSLGGE